MRILDEVFAACEDLHFGLELFDLLVFVLNLLLQLRILVLLLFAVDVKLITLCRECLLFLLHDVKFFSQVGNAEEGIGNLLALCFKLSF